MIKSDTFDTPQGAITVQPIRHSSFVIRFGDYTVYCDPSWGAGLYTDLPKPDLVLITHEHSDHLDPETFKPLLTPQTRLIGARIAIGKLDDDLAARAEIMQPGETRTVDGLTITAIPAHNLAADRMQFHPVGNGNGYVIAFGGKHVYIPGDTEDVPEMRALEDIDIAFLPMNLPYTMSGKQAADAAKAFRPKVVYPFHYLDGGEEKAFTEAMAGENGIEVRQRDWYEGA